MKKKSDTTKRVSAGHRKAAVRAFKAAMKSLKQEPEVVIISGSKDGIQDSTIKEISDWLFHRRDEDGS